MAVSDGEGGGRVGTEEAAAECASAGVVSRALNRRNSFNFL